MTPHVKAGDPLEIRLALVDRQGQPVNLNGIQSATWWLARGDARGPSDPPVLTKQLGDGVTVASAADGRLTITVPGADTAPLKGRYLHKTRVVDAAGRAVTAYYQERRAFTAALDVEPEHFG